MSSFSYFNEGQNLFLVYKKSEKEVVNEKNVHKLVEKKREGVVKTQYYSDENGNYFKYDVTSYITLKQLLDQGINDKMYCSILHSVAATLELLKKEDIGVENLILNEELIYYDCVTKVVNFICIPTNSFVNTITPGMIVFEFSKLIISRMEVTSNLILEVNDFLSKDKYSSEEFNCLINSILIMSNKMSENKMITIREYSQDSNMNVDKESIFKQMTIQPEGKNEQNNIINNCFSNVEKKENTKENIKESIKDFAYNTKKNIIDKVGDLKKEISKVLDNVKNVNINSVTNNNVVNENVLNNTASTNNINNNYNNNINMAMGKETYQEAIRQEVAQQKEDERKRMEDMRRNFDANIIFNNQMDNALESNNGVCKTVIIDCVTGEVSPGGVVNTSNPYLIRESTGEKIYIDSNNFKLGRGKKFVDYYVGGNDTVSKVHAYITSNAKEYFIVDNSSRNHTFLNGKVLEPVKQMILGHRAKIKLAKEEFTFYLY